MEILMNGNRNPSSPPSHQSKLEHSLPQNLQQQQNAILLNCSRPSYASFNMDFHCGITQGLEDFHCAFGCSGQETPYDCCECEESYFQQMSCVDLSNSEIDKTQLEYEYKEPDENFISIDDMKVKNFLLTLVEEQKKDAEVKKQQLKENNTPKPQVILAVIDLEDDDDDNDNDANTKEQLIPTSQKEQILESIENQDIEQVDLLDSSSESNDEDDDDDNEIPLAAAASVSCELDCDKDDEEIDILPSCRETDEEEIDHDVDFVDENEEGIEVRWDELETVERQSHVCSLCGKKVLTSYNLRRHMMIHTGERPYGCDLCHRRFREFSDLKKHRRRHSQERNYKCMVCRVNKPSVKDPTKCLSCCQKGWVSSIRNSKSSERPHTSTIKDKKVITPKIFIPTSTATSASSSPTRFPSSSTSPSPSLQKINTQLLLDSVEAVRRPVLNKIGVFTKKEYPCPLCNRPFGTKHNLKRHFMIHTGEKPFNCSECRKPFREYSTLKKHMQTHVRGRWYKCAHCIEKFTDYLEYTKHKTTHPKDADVTSTTSSQIVKKKKRHDSYDSNDSSIEDSLECYECGQRFTDIELYTSHLKEHDPTMFLFECYICKKTFEQREQLVAHITKQHEFGGEEQTNGNSIFCQVSQTDK